MANVFAPTGLVYSHNSLGAAPTYQMSNFKLLKAYSSNIPLGSVVGLAGGYVTLAADNPTRILGVFAGVYPYFDTTLQATAHGLNGAWVASATSSGDVDVAVITDPTAIFRLQCSGIAPAVTWPGLNLNWVAGTNATLSATGVSVLAGDSATPAANAAFPFNIVGTAGVVGGPQDPTQANPTLLVRINPALSIALLGLGA